MIIIPMAGTSSRFLKAGYKQPKYMLCAHNKTLFDHAVNSFKNYFKLEKFLFIVRDIDDTVAFVKQRVTALGITDFHISILEKETRGQAETVTLGLKEIDYQGAITIFNIDTFRLNFHFPDLTQLGKGYLEVFRGKGDNWSFVKPINSNSTQVYETAEKNPISNLCCTGLYYFSDIDNYLLAYYKYLAKPQTEWDKAELYVAPLYNILIQEGLEIHYHLINRNDVIFCGVPIEYEEFRRNYLLPSD